MTFTTHACQSGQHGLCDGCDCSCHRDSPNPHDPYPVDETRILFANSGHVSLGTYGNTIVVRFTVEGTRDGNHVEEQIVFNLTDWLSTAAMVERMTTRNQISP